LLQARCLEASIAEALARDGWATAPGFVDREGVDVLAGECLRAWYEGRFRRAGIGRGEQRAVRPDIRGDDVLWLDASKATPAQRAVFERFERLRVEINRATFLGLHAFESHFAVYPEGASYERHLDRFEESVGRVVSCVLYLNRDWTDADGGHLRLYLDDPEGAHRDVRPEGGTLAVFLSRRFEHEVLPARRRRLSWTGWFRVRPLAAAGSPDRPGLV
jgi:SM-20-related protein